ncbi:hypothetical protein A9G24_12045 [Gilliamella sp. App6-5]|nr:hypothetical protein A9G24_12045 [Gilliamella apicola]
MIRQARAHHASKIFLILFLFKTHIAKAGTFRIYPLLETLFGVIGLIFAPIFYAFIKLSLKELRII